MNQKLTAFGPPWSLTAVAMLLLACCPLLAQLLRFNVPAKTGSTSLFAILSHDEGFMEAASTTDANLSSTNVPVGVCGSHISVSRLGHADDGSEWLSEHPDGTLAVILREPCERDAIDATLRVPVCMQPACMHVQGVR